MDQFSRRIIGFAAHRGIVDGVALCRMFHRAIRGQSLPKYLSTDNDPLYRFEQWQANLRLLEVQSIKTVPYVPLSHPFVERLIGSLRRECLDRTLFWTTADLENKLLDCTTYFNQHRTHAAREGRPPDKRPTAGRTFSLIDGNRTAEAGITHRLLDTTRTQAGCRLPRNLGSLGISERTDSATTESTLQDRRAERRP